MPFNHTLLLPLCYSSFRSHNNLRFYIIDYSTPFLMLQMWWSTSGKYFLPTIGKILTLSNVRATVLNNKTGGVKSTGLISQAHMKMKWKKLRTVTKSALVFCKPSLPEQKRFFLPCHYCSLDLDHCRFVSYCKNFSSF
jgi:hypothetical protein